MSFNDLHNLEGLQFIPVNEFKQPTVKDWQTTIKKHDLSKCYGVGLVCGTPSGNVEALDFDLKYSLSPTFFEDYKQAVNSQMPDLLKKMVVQKTKNNGYHFIYRCEGIQGNLKLANRHTTDVEKQDTYELTYRNEVTKSSEDVAIKLAKKASENDKVRVLIESRGIGGQIVIAPTTGYEIVFGDLYSITEITKEERECLFSTARMFNEVYEEVIIPKTYKIEKTQGKSPFEDYNERGDVVQLLVNNGWKVVSTKGKKTMVLRSGNSTAKSSGNFDHERNWFSVFTTSTEFEPARAYLPYAVFAYLECNKDFSLASKKLLELGYGEAQKTTKTEQPSTRQIPSRIKLDDSDLSFLATPEDYNGYLKQVIDGTLPQGLTTGIPSLDQYFLFKEGNMVNINGIDNVGKSVFVWWLLLLATMLHGWKGIVFSSENTLGGFMRKMIQFYWGKQLRGDYAMSEKEFDIAKSFIEKHFILIKAQEDLYNYKDILNMIKKAKVKYPQINFALIDPYNSLKTDLSGYSKLNTHEFHYEALSELKAYGQKNTFGVFITHHAITSSARAKDSEKKYPIAPQKADTEGGGKVANKTDEFLTVHRLTQHPEMWKVTELHVRKVKDTDTGGRVTPFDEPVKFEMYKGGCGFKEYKESGYTSPIDPIMEWHYKNGTLIDPQKFGQQVIDGLASKDDDFDTYTTTDDNVPF